MATPHGVEAAHRVANGRKYLFLLNHNESEQAVNVPATFRTWDGADWTGTLPAMGVQVFVEE